MVGAVVTVQVGSYRMTLKRALTGTALRKPTRQFSYAELLAVVVNALVEYNFFERSCDCEY